MDDRERIEGMERQLESAVAHGLAMAREFMQIRRELEAQIERLEEKNRKIFFQNAELIEWKLTYETEHAHLEQQLEDLRREVNAKDCLIAGYMRGDESARTVIREQQITLARLETENARLQAILDLAYE